MGGLTLSNNYERLHDLLDEEKMEVNPHWGFLKEDMNQHMSRSRHIGEENQSIKSIKNQMRQHKDCICVETINKLQLRKEKKAVPKQQYNSIHKSDRPRTVRSS